MSYVRQHRIITDDSALGAQGRVATLNVLCRKMQSLMGFRDPEFLVENTNPQDEPFAAIFEAAFKQVQAAGNWGEQVQYIKRDAVLYGTGLCKLGFGSEFVYDEPAWSAPVPGNAKKLLTPDERVAPYGPTTEYTNFDVQEGFPVFKHVSVRDVFFNMGVRNMSDIRRIYHVNRRPLIDVLHDSRYATAAKRQAHVVTQKYDDYNMFALDPYSLETEYSPCIECYDLPSRQFCVFNEYATVPLLDWTPFPFPIRSPYRMWSPIPMDQTVWGIPYALLIMGQARSINRVRAAIQDAVSRDGKTVFFYKANMIEEEELREVQSARDRQWVGLENYDGEKPIFEAYQFPSVNPDVVRLGDLHWSDQAFVSGLTDQTRNVASSDETATSAQYRAEQQNITVEDFSKALEKFLEMAAGDVARIMLARWNPDRLVKVVGNNENIFFWTKFNVQRILGAFTLKIIAGSTQKRDRATQRKQWTEVLPRIGEIYQYIMQETMNQVQGPIDWHEVLRETLDQYDSTLARRVLRPEMTARHLMRLMSQHNELPLGVSPELAAQVRAIAERELNQGQNPPAGQEGLGQATAPGFEERQGIPAPQTVNPQGGELYSEQAGMAGRLN